jgi:hypothetical protein
MNPEPTVTTSLDYLVELSDDGKRADQQEPEVIEIPPAPRATVPSLPPASVPDHQPDA